MKKAFIILLLLSYKISHAQSISLDQQVQKRFNEMTLDADTSIFTGFRSTDWLEYKSFLSKQKKELADSAFGLAAKEPGGYFLKHLATDNWIQANGNNSVFAIDPYIDAAIGREKENNTPISQISAGIHIQGMVNDKLSYSAAYIYSSEQLPNYLNTYIQGNQGYAFGKGQGTLMSNGGYSFSQFTGNITFLPSKHFLITVGNGKNFIGDGYRSLLLSDNASNYPYIRLQARYWKITYNVLYTYLDNPRYQVGGSDQRKYSVMHYLGIDVSKKFQLGIFDNVIFYARDTTIHRGFDVQYLNPVIFMRPVEFALGSPDNAFLGLTGKYHIYKKGFLYGQIGIDDLNFTTSIQHHAQSYGNKYALQLGIWNKDLFNIKKLSWRFEWEGVRPYTYTHGFDKPGINYTTDNQALADPFGANFHEFISIFQYANQRWYSSLENLFTIRGEQPAGLPYPIGYDLWAGDLTTFPYAPVFGSTTTQGVKNKYFYNQLIIGYLINARNRLGIQADIVYRKHTSPTVGESDFYFSIGVKTGLYNFYKDF